MISTFWSVGSFATFRICGICGRVPPEEFIFFAVTIHAEGKGPPEDRRMGEKPARQKLASADTIDPVTLLATLGGVMPQNTVYVD